MLDSLRRLPRLDETWVVDRRAVGAGDLVLWMTRDGRLRMGTPVPTCAGAEIWLPALVLTAEQPVSGFSPGLPAEVQVLRVDALEQLKRALEPLGIPVFHCPSLPELDLAYEMFERAVERPTEQTYMEILEGPLPDKKGVVKAFYEEAERLHREAPWTRTSDSDLFRVGGLAPEPVLVSVLGGARIQEGLAVFPTEAAARQFFMRGGRMAGERCLSLTFNSSEEMPGLVREARRLECALAEGDLVPLALTVSDENRVSNLEEMDLLTRASQAVRLHLAGQVLPDGVAAEWPVRLKTPRRRKVELLQLRVELRHTDVWRRVRVVSDLGLEELHLVLQQAMGWEDGHPHRFVGRSVLENPEAEIRELFPRVGSRIAYLYDFGDEWLHDLVLEKRLPLEDGAPAAELVEGERACPPEDCGGVPGYLRLVEALTTPRHPDEEEMRERFGRFDPAEFDLARAQRKLRAVGEA